MFTQQHYYVRRAKELPERSFPRARQLKNKNKHVESREPKRTKSNRNGKMNPEVWYVRSLENPCAALTMVPVCLITSLSLLKMCVACLSCELSKRRRTADRCCASPPTISNATWRKSCAISSCGPETARRALDMNTRRHNFFFCQQQLLLAHQTTMDVFETHRVRVASQYTEANARYLLQSPAPLS